MQGAELALRCTRRTSSAVRREGAQVPHAGDTMLRLEMCMFFPAPDDAVSNTEAQKHRHRPRHAPAASHQRHAPRIKSSERAEVQGVRWLRRRTRYSTQERLRSRPDEQYC
jgi:hypothetical protein